MFVSLYGGSAHDELTYIHAYVIVSVVTYLVAAKTEYDIFLLSSSSLLLLIFSY